MKQKLFLILLIAVFALSACAPAATPAPVKTEEPVKTAAPIVAPTEAPVVAEVPTKAPVACEKPLNLAIIGAMTGTNASLGEWMVRGVTLAVEEKNAAGGIKGCPINIKIFDDTGDPTTSVSVVQKVIAEENVIAAWATTNSS
jgi:ABC-type branched-subunit amino acid transport system substrate-binding protein